MKKTQRQLKKEVRFNKSLIYVIYATLIITSVLGWLITNNVVEKDSYRRLKNETVVISNKIKHVFDRLDGALLDMRAHFQDKSNIKIEEFSKYSDQSDLLKRFPGIRSFGYAKVLNSKLDIQKLTDTKISEGIINFKVWPKSDNIFKAVTIITQPDDWVNRSTLGFDLGTKKNWEKTLINSVNGDQSRISNLSILVNSRDGLEPETGFAVFLPHYKVPEANGGINSKISNLHGLFFVIIEASDFFLNSFEQANYLSEKVNYQLYTTEENKSVNSNSLIYRRFDKLVNKSFSHREEISILGTTWYIETEPLPHFTNFFKKYAAEVVLLGLLLLSLVIILLISYSQRYLASEALFSIKAQEFAVKAEAANRAKTFFLANMSHEIRTPLGAIMGYSELLIDPEIADNEKQEMVKNIQKNGETLSKLLNDILDSAKIEAGKINIVIKPASVKNLLAEIEADQRLKAKTKNLSLNFKTSTEIPDSILVDEFRLKQILTNLINNAVRFTKKGGITVTATTGVSKDKKYVFFEIKDTGIGLPKDKRGFLFKPFEQADTSSTRKFGGTGLGLNLSKNLANLLDGDIKLIASEPNKGTTFIVEIPLIPVDVKDKLKGEKPKEDPNINFEGLHFLLVEDSKENQQIFKMFLNKSNAKVTLAKDGLEALKEGVNPKYDLILMDIQIPEIDGREVTKRLRSEGIKKPILAITAHAQKAEIVACLDAGCDSHLAKPFTKTQLLTKIHSMLETDV